MVYVESIRSKLPTHVYSFVCNPSYFNLDSRSSLHDAWLEKLMVRETANGERRQNSPARDTALPVWPYHDRWIHLNYTGVTQYSFHTPLNTGSRSTGRPRTEIYLHTKIRLDHDGLLLHELLFERGSALLIECPDITHSEEMIAKP
jgi:hypothetical protein